MNNYVIINKDTVLKKIEELEKEIDFYNKVAALSINPNKVKAETELSLLKQILSQSAPLTPVLEQTFDAGCAYTVGSQEDFKQTHLSKRDYIRTLIKIEQNEHTYSEHITEHVKKLFKDINPQE
jgi:hypothetical protein